MLFLRRVLPLFGLTLAISVHAGDIAFKLFNATSAPPAVESDAHVKEATP